MPSRESIQKPSASTRLTVPVIVRSPRFALRVSPTLSFISL